MILAMIATSTVTSKNQTTLPKVVVEALKVKPSDKLTYEIDGNRVILRARTGRLLDLLKEPPLMPPPEKPFTVEQLNAAIGTAYAEHGMRGISNDPAK